MKYIGYFNDLQHEYEGRNATPSAITKMDYIANVLSQFDSNVEIISASTESNNGNWPGRILKLDNGAKLICFKANYWKGNRIEKLFKYIKGKKEIFVWLMKNCKKREKIIVYHSLDLICIITLLKKIKKIQLIMEVEEIYGDVTGKKRDKAREMKFFQEASAFIFPTQLLETVVNIHNKPTVYVHGTYGVEPDRKCSIFNYDLKIGSDRIIHCVYAGTLDPRKGGAEAAAEAAEFLPEGYHIHILGFGTKQDVQNIQNKVKDIASRSKARLTYDGVLSGEDYIHFIQSCDIGLSTQNPNAAFNTTSFPSKILSYMANGLRVVSIRIPVIEQSAVGNKLYYYDKQTPQQIAEAIMLVNINDDYDSRKLICELSKKFEKDIKKLLEEM